MFPVSGEMDKIYTVKNKRRLKNPSKEFMTVINPFEGFFNLRLFFTVYEHITYVRKTNMLCAE
jgi:hypothetical protein